MAFGRANSLTINTGATNSLFASQQNNNNNNTTQQQGGNSGNMFGSTQQNNTAGSSLFGGSNTQQNQSGGSSLFGGGGAQQSQPSGGLFGSKPQQSSGGGGGLFGSSTQQSSQPQQSSGFGGSLFGGQQNQNQNQNQQQGQQSQSGGLFGGGSSLFGGQQNQNQNQNQQQGQQPQTGGLFGGAGGGGGSSLFGGGQQNQNQQQQQQQQQKPGGLFGGSLFGGSTTQTNQTNTGNMNNASTFGNSLLNNSQQQPQQNGQQQPPSLLNASRYNHAQYVPFAGSLRMGQNGAGSTTNASNPSGTVSGVKVSWSEIRPTTRFADLIDPVKEELEKIDRMIQQQESHCAQIQALMPRNESEIASLSPDVEIIKDKADAVETVLSQDAQAVKGNANVVQGDRRDFERCERVVRELQLPRGYQPQPGGERGYGASQVAEAGAEDYDTNLVGNYFMPLAKDVDSMLKRYEENLAEIEGHMRTIEGNAVHQAQGLAARRAGLGGAGAVGGDDNVRELADTLRGFEKSILSAAAMVGECRDGVNGLTMGSFGQRSGRY